MGPAVIGMAVQTAFMSIAPRLVGASFRIGEAFHPEVQKRGATLDPQVVINRELVGLVLSWIISFGASIGTAGTVARLKINPNVAMFVVSIFGTAASEAISRLIAYRKKPQPDLPLLRLPPNLPQQPARLAVRRYYPFKQSPPKPAAPFSRLA